MSLLLHVEYNASSESAGVKMLELLSRMADIVHRDHSEVYTYLFRHDNQGENKLIFTELYGNEQVFLDHARDSEFSKLYQQAFNNKSGKSQKELCIRNDIDQPLLSVTASILDNYLHVTYIPIEQGFLYRNIVNKTEEQLLIVCSGCDENIYERLNALVTSVTCVTFKESDEIRQLIAVIVEIPNEKILIQDNKPSINTVEIVCLQEETIKKFQDFIQKYFQIQFLHVQTNFSGYILHKSS